MKLEDSRHIPRGLALLGLALCMAPACAASLTVSVEDSAGHPLADAIVYAEPVGHTLPKVARAVEIEQKGRKFLPPVTVVQTGTSISFPNNDTVRHHIYSFSPAKIFEQKLYTGVPEKPVNFDKAGTVVLGCNIHDQMVAYVHVVETPYFAKTNASGKAKIDGVQPGNYRLKAWHFNLPATESIPEQSLSQKAADSSASFKLNAKPRPADADSRAQSPDGVY